MPFSPHTSEAFARYIENQVKSKRMSYLEAVIAFCQERQLEPDAIVRFLNDKIKSKLDEEGQRLNLLTKQTGLPLE